MYSALNDKYEECTNTLICALLVRLFLPSVLGYSLRINVCVVPPLETFGDGSRLSSLGSEWVMLDITAQVGCWLRWLPESVLKTTWLVQVACYYIILVMHGCFWGAVAPTHSSKNYLESIKIHDVENFSELSTHLGPYCDPLLILYMKFSLKLFENLLKIA